MRISKLPLNIFVFVEALQIFRSTDGYINKRRAHRGLANLFKLDSIARGSEFLKVLDDFCPAREFAIVAGREAKDVFGLRNNFGLGVDALERSGLKRETGE